MTKSSKENDDTNIHEENARNSQEIIQNLLSDVVSHIDTETRLSEATSNLTEATPDDGSQQPEVSTPQAMDVIESSNHQMAHVDRKDPSTDDFTSVASPASQTIQKNTDLIENESVMEHIDDILKSETIKTLDECADSKRCDEPTDCTGVNSMVIEIESVQSDSTTLDKSVVETNTCKEERPDSTKSKTCTVSNETSLTETHKHLKYLISEKRRSISKESVDADAKLEENIDRKNLKKETESLEMATRGQDSNIGVVDGTGSSISDIKHASVEANVEPHPESPDEPPDSFDTVDSGTVESDSTLACADNVDSVHVQDSTIDKASGIDTGEIKTQMASSTALDLVVDTQEIKTQLAASPALDLVPADKSGMSYTAKVKTPAPLLTETDGQGAVVEAINIPKLADNAKQEPTSFSRESTLSPESAMELETRESTEIEMNTEIVPIQNKSDIRVLDDINSENTVGNITNDKPQGNAIQAAPSLPTDLSTSVTIQPSNMATPEKMVPDQGGQQIEQLQSSKGIIPAVCTSEPNVPLEKTPVKQSQVASQAQRQFSQLVQGSTFKDQTRSGIPENSSVQITKPNVPRDKTPVKQIQPGENSAGKLTNPTAPLEKTPVKQTQPTEISAGKLTKPNVQPDKTPVKQIQSSKAIQRPSPQLATKKTPSKAGLKSPQPSGKQSFIDNLIAKGVPIVIPDDDDDESSKKDNMPKARSNVFKMKSQQYKQQSSVQGPGASSRSFGMRESPASYDPHTGLYQNIPSSQNRPASSPQRDRVAISPQRAALQAQSDTYYQQQSMFSPQKESFQTGEFAHPSFSSPSRRNIQQADMMTSPQAYRSADQYMPQLHQSVQSQYRASPEHEVYSPTHQLRSPPPYTSIRNVTPSKRVSFSPVVHVAHSSSSTPPRYPSPQGQRSQGPPNISVSPRMGSPRGAQQVSNVRRNITYPHQQSIVRTSKKGTNEAATIVIDDDTPTPQAPPRKTAPRPTPAKDSDYELPSLAHIMQEPTPAPMLPIIASVTSMAKMTEQSFPPEIPAAIPQSITLPVTVSAQPAVHPASPRGGAIQQPNKKTPVKRTHSDDTMMSGESPIEEHARKRRNTVCSVIPQAAYASSSVDKAEPSTAGLTGTEKVQSEPVETVSPSKIPPEVVIDIDVDDKTHFKRRLNIEQGHITKASPLSSPESESMHMVSSRNENVTSPDSTAPSSTSKSKPKPKRPGRPRNSTGPSFACGDCEKTFASKAALKTHFKKHTKDKPFECDVCGKHFSQKSSLKKHIYTHFKDKDE